MFLILVNTVYQKYNNFEINRSETLQIYVNSNNF